MMNSLIIELCYKNAVKKSDRDTEKNFTAECNFCGKKYSGNVNNTFNFLKHTEVSNIMIYEQLKIKIHLPVQMQLPISYHFLYLHYINS